MMHGGNLKWILFKKAKRYKTSNEDQFSSLHCSRKVTFNAVYTKYLYFQTIWACNFQTSLPAGFFLTKGEKKAFQNTWKDCEDSWPCIIIIITITKKINVAVSCILGCSKLFVLCTKPIIQQPFSLMTPQYLYIISEISQSNCNNFIRLIK